jgi:glycoside/pentoside/hexuronide:cation symporter, GPH family
MNRLKFSHKLGYGLGDFANNVTFAMSSVFLLAFYTDVLGISAMAAGTLFLVARIWDAINDPMMGALADHLFRWRKRRTGTAKVDKFRPFLIYGSIPVIVTGILMFVSPAALSGGQRLAWAYATYIAWGMAYTFVNIPYGSLAAVMTKDPVERSALSVARGLGGLLGNIVLRIAVPLILVAFGEDQGKGYLVAMIIAGVIGVAAYAASWRMTEERVDTGEQIAVTARTGTFRALLRNRPFVAVAVASIAMLFGMMVNGAMTVYYFRENLGALGLMSLTALTAVVPMLLVSTVATRLVARFGVQKTVASTSLFSALVWVVLLFLPSNAWVFIVGSLVAMMFLMVPNMLIWGMVSDCIDYNQFLTGERQEGLIYGSYSFVRKTGQALAGFASGIGLGLIGYVANATTQSAGALFGIKMLTIGMPAVAMFISWLALRFIWDLTPEKRAEVESALAARAMLREYPHA